MAARVSRDQALGTFVVEGFLPDATAMSLNRATTLLERHLASLGPEDGSARAVAATLVPSDESAYWVVVAPSAKVVALACAAAGLQVERIVAALEVRADEESRVARRGRAPPKAKGTTTGFPAGISTRLRRRPPAASRARGPAGSLASAQSKLRITATEGDRAMHASRIQLSAAAAALLLAAAAGTALATPSSGVLGAPILARGDFAEPVDVEFKIGTDLGTVVSNAPDAGEVVVQQITIAPGGTTGWHSHPGPVVVVVTAGALTFVDEEQGVCTETTYSAGTAFVDPGQGHAHSAFNRGTVNLELIVTYFDVPVGGSPRIDQPAAAAC